MSIHKVVPMGLNAFIKNFYYHKIVPTELDHKYINMKSGRDVRIMVGRLKSTKPYLQSYATNLIEAEFLRFVPYETVTQNIISKSRRDELMVAGQKNCIKSHRDVRIMAGDENLPKQDLQSYSTNLIEAEFIQNLNPVGAGPSGKTWPR